MKLARILAAAVVIAFPAIAQRPSERTPRLAVVNDAAWWTGRYTPPAPLSAEVDRTSQYVVMPDGTRLAVDSYLPKGMKQASRLPTVMEQTRYHRSFELPDGSGCSKSERAINFARHGYAYVIVDVRGTGASFGSRKAEFDTPEIRDGDAIINWITRQSWSDGKVGATGVSYVGTTAELVLLTHNPALKAVAPQFAGSDFYSEISFPGGVPNQRFTTLWGMGNGMLDQGKNPGAKGNPPCAVDGPDGGALRAQAIVQHSANINVVDAQRGVAFRDDRNAQGITIDDRSPFHYQRQLDRDDVPVYLMDAWGDIGYAGGAITRWLNTRNPNSRMTIGAWNHGGNYFYAPGITEPTRPQFWIDEELLRYFDWALKGVANGFGRDARIHYFTTGINRWRATNVWPVKGMTPARWCFTANNMLDRKCTGRAGVDTYRVRTDTDSGRTTRWDTAIGGPVVYADRRAEDAKLLTYTSAPLARPIEVTGEPKITLSLTTDAPDGNVIAYLEEVRPDGKVLYATEGLARLSHSRAGVSPYRTLTAPHSHRRADSLGNVAGKRLDFSFSLLPLSHVFAAGSSIRIAIAGADGTRFAGSADGATYRINYGQQRLSSLTLPSAAH